MSKAKVNVKQIGFILFAVIMLLQVGSLIYMGSQKAGMHIDDNYSYILSNSYDSTKISNDAESWNQWLTGSDFDKFVTVEKGEQFAYSKVYVNNTFDAHPPMFYFLLHTVSSFFPGQYSPWFGLGLNITLILAAQVMLFFFAKEITGSTLWGCVPVAIYGGMQVFFDTTIFIRMYPLVTLLTILLAWKHYHFIKNPKRRSTIVWCALIVFMGVFTQYYFAFISFYLALATCIFLMVRKEWKTLFIYVGSLIGAVAFVFLIYPAGITQITGSETNNVGNAVMGGLFDFSRLFSSVSSMMKSAFEVMLPAVFNVLIPAACIVIITVVLSFVLRKKGQIKLLKLKECAKELIPIGVLFVVLLLCFVTVSHVSAQFLYVRYIFNLFPLFMLLASVLIYKVIDCIGWNKTIVAVGIVLFWTVSTLGLAQENRCSYLMTRQAAEDKQMIELIDERPLVVLNNGTTYQPTSLLNYLRDSEEVYMANYEEFDNPDECLSQVDCSEGVVFIVLTDTYWSQGYDGDEVMSRVMDKTTYLDSYSELGECNFSNVYLAY